ncbi:MAG TPA: hypothetical protein VE968_09990 [Sphingomicrobium sp.]|nr:hypothetical protein [Sphingomicrobium sp.]
MVTDNNGRPNDNDAGASSKRQAVIESYESVRERTLDTLTEAPLLALAGGLAAGALIAALLPASETETQLISPTARRVRNSARVALDAARQSGTQRLDELGLNREKGEETIRNLLGGLGDAARASANAAVEAVRKQG